MWCRDITECLVTEGDRLEAMKEAEQMCVTVRQNKLLLFLIPMIGLHFHRFRRRRCDLWSSTLQHNFCLNATETWRKALKRGEGHHFIFLTHKIQKFCYALLIFFISNFPLEFEQACCTGSWRASKTDQEHSVCFDHYWCACKGYSHRNGGTSGH